MPIFADLALVRRERALQQTFRAVTPTASDGAAPEDKRLRLHVLLDRERLGIARAALAASRAVAQFLFEQERHEEVRFWANRHRTIVLLEAGGADMLEMAAYFGTVKKVCCLIPDEALDERPVAAAFEPVPAMEGKVLFGRFAPLAL